MKIKVKFDLGACEGYTDVKRGDVIDVPEASAKRYIALGYAVPYGKSAHAAIPVEKAVAPEHEKAVVEAPEEPKPPEPLDEPVKRTPSPQARRR